MRLSIILRYVGMMLMVVASFMLLSALVSWYNGMDTAFYPLLLSTMLTTVLGAFPLIFVPRTEQITHKESYGIVVGAWIVACVVGMFPYLIWGGEFTLVNAWFESVSGFTTTGASILRDVEALPRGLLFWRSTTNWMGGAGVVMFALLVLPTLGRNKLSLSYVELSTLARDNYHYRAKRIVHILLVVYVGMTALSLGLLRLAGMNWFDAVNHAMASVATAGFSTHNASIAYFNSPAIELILVGTMFMAGIHFGLIFATLTGRRRNLFRSEVVRVYTATLLFASAAVAIVLFMTGAYPTLLASMRHALFQVVSLATTTGFGTADSNAWPPFAIMVLLFVSLVGACAGSTAGGIKYDRLVLAVKAFKAKILQQQHPSAVIPIRLGGVIQSPVVVHFVMLYIVVYIGMIFLASAVSTLFGIDLLTSFSSSIACIGSIGPGFGEVSAVSNFASLPVIVKIQDTLLMLFGRLEIFGLFQLFLLKWWV